MNLNDLVLHGKGGEWIPLHPSQIQMTPAFEEQVRVGVRMMMKKLNSSIDQSSQ